MSLLSTTARNGVLLLTLLVWASGCQCNNPTDTDTDVVDTGDTDTGDTDTGDTGDTDTGPNQPPSAVIDAPANQAQFDEGEAIDLAGHATDPEDGALPGTALSWTSSLDGALGTGRTVSWSGAAIGTHTVVLTAQDFEGLTDSTSITVEVLAIGVNQPPVVTITAPSPSSTWTVGDAVSLEATAVDDSDGAMPGTAISWDSSIDGPLGSGSPLVVSTLTQGAHTLTAMATDSDTATGTDTVSISVNPPANDPPVVTITAPTDGSAFVSGAVVSLEGNGSDTEDITLPGSSLAWSSSRDGALGTGSPLITAALTVGSHQITLLGTDSATATGSDQIDLNVLAPNSAPVVTITAPPPNTTVVAGTNLTFTGTADDVEDGPLTGTALRWSSNRDGLFGTASPLDFASLTEGAHTITLTGTDSGSLTGTDTVSLTITPASVNLDPVALLTGPTTAYLDIPLLLDGSSSYDPDGSIVSYRFAFGDGTSDQLGTGNNAVHTYSATGSVTAVLTVTDDQGATDTASLFIDVIDPIRVPEVVLDAVLDLGSFCDVALDSADRPHVIFRHDTHAQLYYAHDAGSGWLIELVDGPGFDIGSAVGVMPGRLVVDDLGGVHVGYGYADGRYAARYAHRPPGGGWINEDVGTSQSFNFTPVAIALDPANGDRPTIAYTEDRTYDAPTLAFRTGPMSWSRTIAPETDYSMQFTGGLAFAADGTAHLTHGAISRRVRTWSDAGGWGSSTYVTYGPNYVYLASLALDSLDQPVFLHEAGVEHDDGGWVHSEVEDFEIDWFDADMGPGDTLAIITRHQGDAEIITAPVGGFFARSYEGPMDAAWPGIAVGNSGVVRACFFRDGNLVVY